MIKNNYNNNTKLISLQINKTEHFKHKTAGSLLNSQERYENNIVKMSNFMTNRMLKKNVKNKKHRIRLVNNKKIIILTAKYSDHYPHFIHYMQYLYWCTDIILNDTNFMYIIIEPNNKSNGRYVKSYCLRMLQQIPNVIFTNKYEGKNVYKEYKYLWGKIKSNFILDDKHTLNNYINWFPNNNSEKMRSLYLNNLNNNIKIGIVNRKKNRILINDKELRDNIKKLFNIDVDITYFEDKSFDYQIKFFNEHKIIISPHGAQLCSIPFSQDDSLIIECVHEEWHPYYYFPGLSYTSNKYHVMICDNHAVFPSWHSETYDDKKRNAKLNITANIEKITNIIKIYLKNNKLESHNCYLI